MPEGTIQDKPVAVVKTIPQRRVSSKNSSTKPKHKNRKRYNSSMRTIRRLHMYFGLILVPFVLLYGVTAILFNHQTWFGSTTIIENDTLLLESVAVASADTIADQVTAELIEKSGLEITRIDQTASYTGDMFIDFPGDESRHRYRIDPDDMSSQLQITPTAPSVEKKSLFPEELDKRETETLKAIVTKLEEISGREKGSIRLMPDVEFRVMAEDEDWTLTYDLRSGDLEQRLTDEPSRAFNLRSFLLRLHKSHGYPSEPGSRMAWAVIVDVMGALMIFWGLSGIFMWWQMKPTRRLGMISVIAGLALSIALGYGMLQLIYY